jgi:hypothetical protein
MTMVEACGSLATEIPEPTDRLQLHLPYESSRRVSQLITAASLLGVFKVMEQEV